MGLHTAVLGLCNLLFDSLYISMKWDHIYIYTTCINVMFFFLKFFCRLMKCKFPNKMLGFDEHFQKNGRFVALASSLRLNSQNCGCECPWIWWVYNFYSLKQKVDFGKLVFLKSILKGCTFTKVSKCQLDIQKCAYFRHWDRISHII